ncbi:hypothetical protein BDZ89DRAFT_544621 [Hymenopellis radicata]|nr:hypothetical protein BDZ89DRAFT_140983 [Hymenopellis radicata]KAF9033694.1 hypothetical protein BDZ89DRAFT_544621 [Hymenopellis radicata]
MDRRLLTREATGRQQLCDTEPLRTKRPSTPYTYAPSDALAQFRLSRCWLGLRGRRLQCSCPVLPAMLGLSSATSRPPCPAPVFGDIFLSHLRQLHSQPHRAGFCPLSSVLPSLLYHPDMNIHHTCSNPHGPTIQSLLQTRYSAKLPEDNDHILHLATTSVLSYESSYILVAGLPDCSRQCTCQNIYETAGRRAKCALD